ncbi:cytochrome c3 family protein [Sphingomonas qilianensis]|uniref:Cytochrome c3 family protein n=1 Tax=Sphingomonas qilianensis TaxID=1736690 RepID=A0ABU9XST2_9SPHN
MRRWGVWLIVVNLCALIALGVAWPHLMIAPGALIPAHAGITRNCFACHAPFQGASANRCTTCHKIADIGIRTTDGAPLPSERKPIAFHQSLGQANCMACHTDHSGPQLVKRPHQSFAHALLRPAVRGQCATCHAAPQTPLHAQAGGNCATCHQTTAWRPATFDHSRFFALTGPHNTSCTTCHSGGDFTRHTCFSCHAHQPAQIRALHAEEGMRNVENCVRCHRNGVGEGGEQEGDD